MSGSKTPSEKLSVLVVDRLIAVGLFRAEKRDGLVAKIATGEMKQEDWKLEIDLASTKAAS